MLYKVGQRWHNERWEAYVMGVSEHTVTLHFPRNSKDYRVPKWKANDYMVEHNMHLDPATTGADSFEELLSLVLALPDDKKPGFVVRLRSLGMLDDRQLQNMLLGPLDAEEAEVAYRMLEIEPWSWPFRRLED